MKNFNEDFVILGTGQYLPWRGCWRILVVSQENSPDIHPTSSLIGSPCKNIPILFLFYIYFDAIKSILYYFILSDLYFTPFLAGGENRPTILTAFYFYFKPILKQD